MERVGGGRLEGVGQWDLCVDVRLGTYCGVGCRTGCCGERGQVGDEEKEEMMISERKGLHSSTSLASVTALLDDVRLLRLLRLSSHEPRPTNPGPTTITPPICSSSPSWQHLTSPLLCGVA